ncbi:hypothetical protein HWV62_14976 [Athelia sp. TMB]|nr:hypothetical protein HWV62_14976 [Athelia sp. TMB]
MASRLADAANAYTGGCGARGEHEQRAHPADLLHRETNLDSSGPPRGKPSRAPGCELSARLLPALASCSSPPTPARDAAGGKTGSAAWQQRARRGVRRGGYERAAVPRPPYIGAGSGASTTRRREREFSSGLRVEGVSI